MSTRLSPSTIALLTLPPLLWAGNAIVGRLVRDAVPPMTLNLLRWSIALLILLPLGRALFRPGCGLLTHWRRYAVLGLLGIGLYNSFQYLALQSSSAINVTLVAAGMPVWMMLVGALFFGVPVTRRQIAGAALSIAGVLLVLCRGQWDLLLAMHLVPGDLYMIAATIAWSFYSWLLTQKDKDPARERADWAVFLLAQVIYGVLWSSLFSAGEWARGNVHIAWSWPVAAALLYVAVGPAVIAFRCWGAGIGRAGPSVGAFFTNLTPLFAAIFSSAFLGETPHLYHGLAFMLIVAGIVFSARR
ncbi:MAG TPA: DMT family transporter [Telluria sp.]|nr:DMT family transporter [Telluria sp.]